MASKDRSEDKSPTDQLVELLVYAPVGMIYEYEDVLEKVVKRGKSQLQLARLVGKMAAKRGQNELEENVGEVLETAAMTVARGITQFGQAVGLAPTEEAPTEEAESVDVDAPPAPESAVPKKPAAKKSPAKKPAAKKPAAKKSPAKKPAARKSAPKQAGPLPIAGYDDLKAKEIVELLGDLSPAQRARVHAHESANRARKTVLGKIDRLDG